MPQDRTESQRASSRANGAKSHGPITVMGRDIASKNAIKHGLLATTLLIPGENREALEALSANFYICFRPESDLEDLYVQRMVEADWKLKRVRTYEQAALAREIAAQGPEVPITIDDDSLLYPMARNAAAFEELHGRKRSPIQTSFMRYQRDFNQARDAFFKLRENAQKWRIPSNEPTFTGFEPGDLVENTEPDPQPSNPDAGIHAVDPPVQAAPKPEPPLELQPAAAIRKADPQRCRRPTNRPRRVSTQKPFTIGVHLRSSVANGLH